jgi:drug/metabolite transporter (DMT)-like permease
VRTWSLCPAGSPPNIGVVPSSSAPTPAAPIVRATPAERATIVVPWVVSFVGGVVLLVGQATGVIETRVAAELVAGVFAIALLVAFAAQLVLGQRPQLVRRLMAATAGSVGVLVLVSAAIWLLAL